MRTPISDLLSLVFSYSLAVVLAWRLLLSRKRIKEDEEEGFGLMENQQPGPRMGPSSVLGLLSTDDLPSTDSSGDERPPPPPPSLLIPQLPPFLHTINEEESDELRSVSSASFASPRTVIESAVSDSDYRSPEARSPANFSTVTEEADEEATVKSPSEEEKEEEPTPVVVQESEEERRHGTLLKELARLGQDSQIRSLAESDSTSERTIMSQVAREMQMIDDMDAMEGDRGDDEEFVVYNEQRRKTLVMDDSASLNSVSINLNATKDSILNQSITSNPQDESSIMETTIIRKERPPFRPPSPPNDLPPPPPDLQSPLRAGPPSAPPPPPPPPPPHKPEDLHLSPVRPAPPPPSILSTSSLLAKAREMSETRPLYNPYDRADQGMSSPPNEPPPPPPPLSNGSGVMHHHVHSQSTKSGYSSREDLLDGAPSRSTVREIPVQRAPSAAPSTQSTVLEYRMPSSYNNPHDMQDEYYRREVISRTIITRSTEALTQQPPLGRSSPIERYITYPDPNTREERQVDYRVTYHRNIEEEERRIREDQDRRKQEEEDRRRREDEGRRLWESREREVLERLRRERELREIEAERTLTERERAEKERIEKDRKDRERAEQQRRADWERMEAERRALEEGDLERRRQVELQKLQMEREEIERRERERLEKERERLERERQEAERKEQERLEKLRIERERIERERIEIERIERIKRERIERERIKLERKKEEEDRLRREKEELERIERERRELEIRERELKELARREAEERERQRLEDEMKERQRREDERREQELLKKIEMEAAERERLRRLQERDEQERLERIRREQQRIEMEKADADRRERERMEEERRERELLEVQRRNKEMREQQRLEDEERERLRQEEERRERERRDIERREAADRERLRRAEEEAERMRIMELDRSAAARRAARLAEQDRDREREELEREARMVAERERMENERRALERLEEERSLADLREKERRNQEIRDRQRQEAADREASRKADDRKSRDKLDMIVRERTERERFEAEKRRLLADKEAMNRKKHGLTSPETLAKLTRPAYFSRENISAPEYTTKVERQVIERVDRNVWVDDMRVPTSTIQTQYSLDTTDENARDRLYNPHDRNGSARGSRYRIQKARRDFFSTDSSAEPEPQAPSRIGRSTEDLSLRSKPEYRGPLLSKFHDSEFKSKTDLTNVPYPHVNSGEAGKEFEKLLEQTERKFASYRMRNSQPSLYSRNRQVSASYLETDVDTGRPDYATSTSRVEETNLDEVHRRSGSVVDYTRMSRRDQQEASVPDHSRSRSADYLMDRRLREETEPPENELQKAMGDTSPRESRMSEHELRFRKSTEKLTVPDWYRENRPTARPTDLDSTMPRIPRGMFDKYAGEVQDLRRSRQSLLAEPVRQVKPPSPKPRRSLSQEVITYQGQPSPRALPGYTVSEIPQGWNMNLTKSSRVVEVADTFLGPKQVVDQHGNVSTRYGGRVTIEEVLDSIFQQTVTTQTFGSSTSLPQGDGIYQGNDDGPGIYTQNYMLMDKVMAEPEKAESLLQAESLFVRCSHCHRTRDLKHARLRFVSCKHCYTYYCSRQCRVNDWPVHSGRCSFARINTLCKDVIMKVREDTQAQSYMSRIARDGYAKNGRGSVNIRLASPQLAQAYVSYGWEALSNIPPTQLLYYYTVEALVQERKEPSLIALCRRYDPKEKFILSVSIIADIEHCPQTPPPETVHQECDWQHQQQPQQPSPMYNPYSQLTLVPTDV